MSMLYFNTITKIPNLMIKHHFGNINNKNDSLKERLKAINSAINNNPYISNSTKKIINNEKKLLEINSKPKLKNKTKIKKKTTKNLNKKRKLNTKKKLNAKKNKKK